MILECIRSAWGLPCFETLFGEVTVTEKTECQRRVVIFGVSNLLR